MKDQLKELKKRLKETEKRAITGDRTVKQLLKDVDFKEGTPRLLFTHPPSASLESMPTDAINLNISRRIARRKREVQGALRRFGPNVRRAYGLLDDKLMPFSTTLSIPRYARLQSCSCIIFSLYFCFDIILLYSSIGYYQLTLLRHTFLPFVFFLAALSHGACGLSCLAWLATWPSMSHNAT